MLPGDMEIFRRHAASGDRLGRAPEKLCIGFNSLAFQDSGESGCPAKQVRFAKACDAIRLATACNNSFRLSVSQHPWPVGFRVVSMTVRRCMIVQGLRRFRCLCSIAPGADHGHDIRFMGAFFVACFRASIVVRHQVQLRCRQYAFRLRAALLASHRCVRRVR